MFRTHILPLNATVGARSALGTTSHCRTEESWQNQLILDRTENVMSEIEEKRNVTSPPSSSHHKESFVSQFHRRRKNEEEQKAQGEREGEKILVILYEAVQRHFPHKFPPWHIPPRTYSYLWLSLLHIRIALPL